MIELFIPGIYATFFLVLISFVVDYVFSIESTRPGKFISVFKWDDGFPNAKSYSVVLKEREEYVKISIERETYKKLKESHKEIYIFSYCEGQILGKFFGWKYRLLLK